mgnify:CR=1 FL=1
MRFAYKPGNLEIFGGYNGKVFGRCRGYKPDGVNCVNGFATDDIFFLEVCLFSFVCKNKEELFEIEEKQFYVCDYDEDAFDELQTLLLESPTAGP